MSARSLPVAARLSKSHRAALKRCADALMHFELTGSGDGWVTAMSDSEERVANRLSPTFVETRRERRLLEYRITAAGKDALQGR